MNNVNIFNTQYANCMVVCMVAWLHCCMVAWLHGCMVAWLHGLEGGAVPRIVLGRSSDQKLHKTIMVVCDENKVFGTHSDFKWHC